MKKKTFLKSLSFTSLALLMGAVGVFAFAPLGASPNNLANANEMVDQINTKADGENIKYAPSALGLDPENDPVIYTTESGLEIKFGGENISDQFPSGKPLSGYPYFTMGTYNSHAVNWIIVGRNTNDDVFLNKLTYHLFSTWKTNNSKHSGTYENKGYYFFKDHYEATTPAGSAINGVVPSKSYVADVTKVTKTVVGTDEVPSGCVLAVSECLLSNTIFNSSNTNNTYEGSNMQTVLKQYYDTTLGLSSTQKNLIQSVDFATTRKGGTTNSTGQKFFALGYTVSGYTQKFCVQTYLTNNTMRTTYIINTTTTNWWCARSGYIANYQLYMIESNGTMCVSPENDLPNQAGNYLRPACVIKLG